MPSQSVSQDHLLPFAELLPIMEPAHHFTNVTQAQLPALSHTHTLSLRVVISVTIKPSYSVSKILLSPSHMSTHLNRAGGYLFITNAPCKKDVIIRNRKKRPNPSRVSLSIAQFPREITKPSSPQKTLFLSSLGVAKETGEKRGMAI